MNRVVVTGMGTVTSLGLDVNTTWNNMLNGQSGVDNIRLFDASKNETKIAAQVSDEFENEVNKICKVKIRRCMTRATRMMMLATDEAVKDSKYDFKKMENPVRAATIVGVVSAGYTDMERQKSTANLIVKSMANAAPGWISISYGIKGPSFSVSTACASSAYAISLACNMIRYGMIDVAIVGGCDSSIEPDYIYGFNQIVAMSTNNSSPKEASCPFSKNRRGFVMGEGAGALILESENSALNRNAKIYAELSGCSFTSEAEHITAPAHDGIEMEKSMRYALEDAKIDINQVDYINAHGTSTKLNDKCETLAIKKLFKERSYSIPISSCKSMIGHTIAACGAIEAIITIKSINEGMLIPTINYNIPDEELDLDYVPNHSRKHKVNVAISNSFGFGGHNATLVFSKYKK